MSDERISCIYILRSFPSSRMTATLSKRALEVTPPVRVIASSKVIRLSSIFKTRTFNFSHHSNLYIQNIDKYQRIIDQIFINQPLFN